MQFFRRRAEYHASHRFVQLVERDASSSTSHLSDLDHLARQFGRLLLDISPRNVDKLKTAVENDDSKTISEFLGRSFQTSNSVWNEPQSSTVMFTQQSLFKVAIKEFKTEWVEFFLNMIVEKSVLFCTGAEMMRNNFKELWIDYRTSVVPMLMNDILVWDVCTIRVPLETFTIKLNVGARVGTCNTIIEWIQSSRRGTGFEHWSALNQNEVNQILTKSRGRMVNATIKIFCFSDVCKIGSNGILRFLLMHKAPSSMFEALLIKWIIVFKWERIWKVRAFKRLALYLVFFVLLNLFVLGLTLGIISYSTPSKGKYLTAVITAFLGVFALLTLWRDYFQLKGYVQDGRKIFPLHPYKGIAHYFSSRQNQIDLMLSLVMLVFFPLVCVQMFYPSIDMSYKAFCSILAIEVLLMWAKALYLAQAFERAGLFVLMIRRVLRECLPYFIMLFGFIIGFGLTMYIALLDFVAELKSRWDDYYYNNWDCFNHSSECYEYGSRISSQYQEWDLQAACNFVFHQLSPSMFRCYHEFASDMEDMEKVKSSFGTLFRSILTMAYAMVGLFDPEAILVTTLVIAIFVLYLALQAIVMFNMLIAAMGDAFDGVRAAEEESFLMARAEFIDQYEASLGDNEIKTMEAKIGKYLYVLIPEDNELETSVPFWRGRMTNIKEDVRQIVLDSQNALTKNTNQLARKLDQQIENIRDIAQNMNEMFRIIREDIKNIKDRINVLEK
eukprot:g7783.t1